MIKISAKNTTIKDVNFYDNNGKHNDENQKTMEDVKKIHT